MKVGVFFSPILKSAYLHIVLLVGVAFFLNNFFWKTAIKNNKNEAIDISVIQEQKSIKRMGSIKGISLDDFGLKKDWIREAQKIQETTSALNTKENIFVSYIDRMKGQLYRAWAPVVRGELERFYGLGMTLSSNSYFITQTRIVLDSEGKVIKAQLLQESGVVDLDDAAIAALNHAGPYPNPPKGLLDQDGHAELQWNFVLRI